MPAKETLPGAPAVASRTRCPGRPCSSLPRVQAVGSVMPVTPGSARPSQRQSQGPSPCSGAASHAPSYCPWRCSRNLLRGTWGGLQKWVVPTEEQARYWTWDRAAKGRQALGRCREPGGPGWASLGPVASVLPLGLHLPGPADRASRQQTSWAALRSLGSQVNGLSEKLGSDVGFVSLNARNATY